MTQEDLSEGVINKSKSKNKCLNWPSRESFISYKRIKNKCNSSTKKVERNFFKEATKDGIMTSKTFWRTIKLFLTNNGCIYNYSIGIENDCNLIRNEQELEELFNEHHIKRHFVSGPFVKEFKIKENKLNFKILLTMCAYVSEILVWNFIWRECLVFPVSLFEKARSIIFACPDSKIFTLNNFLRRKVFP